MRKEKLQKTSSLFMRNMRFHIPFLFSAITLIRVIENIESIENFDSNHDIKRFDKIRFFSRKLSLLIRMIEPILSHRDFIRFILPSRALSPNQGDWTYPTITLYSHARELFA